MMEMIQRWEGQRAPRSEGEATLMERARLERALRDERARNAALREALMGALQLVRAQVLITPERSEVIRFAEAAMREDYFP